MEWLLTSALTRVHPGGVVLITGTRWHKDDIIGCCRRSYEEKWEILDLPAIAEEDDQMGREVGEALFPHKWPADKLAEVKRRYESTGYAWMWEALYQQHPPLTLDAEWPTEYFEGVSFEHWPTDEQLQFKVLALDPSLGKTDTADYSAFVLAGLGWDGVIYIEADIARRDAYTMIQDGIGHCRQKRAAAWAVEGNAFQEILNPIIIAQTSAEGFAVPVHSIVNVMDKVTRIRMRLTPLLAMRKLRFKAYSAGTALLLEQMQNFPNHSFDDGPDALEMACKMIDDIWHKGDADVPVEPEAQPMPAWVPPHHPMVT
jgi:predicted phage terminase large subunit-like protein